MKVWRLDRLQSAVVRTFVGGHGVKGSRGARRDARIAVPVARCTAARAFVQGNGRRSLDPVRRANRPAGSAAITVSVGVCCGVGASRARIARAQTVPCMLNRPHNNGLSPTACAATVGADSGAGPAPAAG